MPEYPEPVAHLQNAIMSLPAVIECFPTPHELASITPDVTRLPGEYADLPQVPIERTNGGLENEVLLQVDIRLERSDDAWLTVEFLAWWVRDQARSGEMVQIRPVALPPKTNRIQLGSTLRFLIEHFHLDEDGDYATTLQVAAAMADSISQNFADYQECFQNPAEYIPEDEDDGVDREEISFEELLELAENGNADAQFEVGQVFARGDGVEQDHDQAAAWFAKAAAQDQPAAQFLLGRCFAKGTGVEQSHSNAFEQYSAAAESGVGIACAAIGEVYAEGYDVEQSHEKAFEWYQRGFEPGEIVCLAEIGDCYEFGNGVAQDLDKALECYDACLIAGFEFVEPAVERVKAQLD